MSYFTHIFTFIIMFIFSNIIMLSNNKIIIIKITIIIIILIIIMAIRPLLLLQQSLLPPKKKSNNYVELATILLIVPLAFESLDPIGSKYTNFLKKLGRRITLDSNGQPHGKCVSVLAPVCNIAAL